MDEEPETIDHCQHCKAAMDVSAFAPFSNVECPHCGRHSRVKLLFGPYVLTRRHAVGGMSMVFVANDSTLDREVAVKILSEDFSRDETRIQAFEEEARITASFSHPHVVRVFRTGKAFGRFYIAMELVEGGHFEHHISERGRIPEAELLTTAIEVAQGLKAAKAAGLIHRDVKPGNILLDADGHAKLVDFGLALVTQGGKAKAAEIWATPFYVPPESVQGREEDFRSDIYALGATLYHALAGVPPCNEETMATKRLLKAKQEVVPLQRVAPDISEKTCRIIDRAMAYDPEDRFSSYDELIRLLNASLKQAPVRGQAPTPPPSRRKLWLSTGIAIATTAVAGIAILSSRTEPPAGVVETPVAPPTDKTQPTPLAPDDVTARIARDYREARDAMSQRKFRIAAARFSELLCNPSVQEPTRSWAGIEATISHYLAADIPNAQRQAAQTRAHLEQVAGRIPAIGSGFADLFAQLETLPPVTCDAAPESGAPRITSALLAGLKNWQQGMIDPAADCFRIAAETTIPESDQWAGIYRELANDYLADHHILSSPLLNEVPATADRCQVLVDDLNLALAMLKTRGRARFNIRARQLDLKRRAKRLEAGR